MPIEAILGFALFGILYLPVVVFQFGSWAIQDIKKLVRTCISTSSATAIATIPGIAPRDKPPTSITASASTAFPEASPFAKISSAQPGTTEGNQLVGVYTFFKP